MSVVEIRDRPDLALGTAQIGMRYGLSGIEHDDESTEALLNAALAEGIAHFDTAAAYGSAERRIGAWHARRATPVAALRIVSKLPAIPSTAIDISGFACSALTASLDRLGIASLEGYMAHGASDGVRQDVRNALVALRNAGKAKWIGVSVYTPEEMNAVLAQGGYDVVQLPLSIANPAARTTGAIERACSRGVAIHVRSIFVQGLLLRDAADLPAHLAAAAPILTRLDGLAEEIGCDRTTLALASVLRTDGVSRVVVGADSPRQLAATAAAARRAAHLPVDAIREAEAIAAQLPADLVDPRRWKR